MSLTYRSAMLSDVGRAREINEDSAFAGDHVFAVADGLGGHQAGEVASALALESVAALDRLDTRKAAAQVADAIRRGNRAVHDRANKDTALQGMGTTLTAVAVHDGVAHIAHVGDSRCYLIRGPGISQLSNDHTLVARMVTEGRLTQEQAESHPQRSILTRALGADRDVDVDEMQVDLLPGDRLVLCSDGLTTVLSDDEIRRLASDGADLEEIGQGLIDEANARGGPDNITVVLVQVGGTATPRAVEAAKRARLEFTFPGKRIGGKFPTRLVVWLLVLVLAIGGAFVGVRAWAGRTWYVGVHDSTVTIFQGLPVEFAGISLSTAKEPTDIAEADVPDWLRPRLEEGIRAGSLAGAREIVEEQIRRNVRRQSPTPQPTETPT